MTCRGYDPKTVKISKAIKIQAAGIMDPHQRGHFIRGYVKVLREATVKRSRREPSDNGE